MKHLSAIAFLFGAASAHAALYETEAFDYATPLHGQTGGTGWNASQWFDSDGDTTLATGSLSYPTSSTAFSSSGNRINLTATDATVEAYRELGTTMNLSTSGATYYSSALFNTSAVAGQISTVRFGDQPDNTGNVRWTYGINSSGNFSVTVSSSQSATSVATVAINTTYLLVSKFRTNTGSSGNDEVFLKIFAPGDDVFEPADDSGWDLVANGGSGVTLKGVRISMSNGAGQTNQLDELRVATTFAEVAPIPEPSSALLLLPALGLFPRRRR